MPEPLIVVEVLSPSTRDKDFPVKLAGYAALPSLAHYLLVDPSAASLCTTIARPASRVPHQHRPHGTLHLDPPGLDLDLHAIYAGSGV
ncbi:MAG TPA: Uma2 family endonuclease [Geminicoccaceae bacterium]